LWSTKFDQKESNKLINRNRKLIILIIMLLAGCPAAFSQGLVDGRQIDLGLKKAEIAKEDYSILLPRDRGLASRQKYIDSLLLDPFLRINEMSFLTTHFDAMTYTDYEAYFGRIIRYLGFEIYNPHYLETMMSASEIDAELNTRIDKKFGLDGAHVIRPYLSAILSTRKLIEGDFFERKGNISKSIYDKCDSVFLFLDDKTNKNYLERYQAEMLMEEQKNDLAKLSPFSKYSELYNIGLSIYTIALQKSKEHENKLFFFRDSIKTTIIDTPHGKIALGGKGNDRYEGDFILIVDIGGNDTYKLKELTKDEAFYQPARLIVDLSGNDVYNGGNYTLGGAVFGVNILIDRFGDDMYRGKEVSLGAALYGIGILHDMDGNDKYMADRFSCGAATFGIGALIDNQGNDEYFNVSMSQGFAGPAGFGALLDNAGDDKYYANPKTVAVKFEDIKGSYNQGASRGFNGLSYGGIGMLADRSGKDLYESKTKSQAYSENYSLGLLLDMNDDDKYSSETLSQAAAVNYSLAYLMDMNGNDEFVSKEKSIAYAERKGFALLYDRMGDDEYKVKNSGVAFGNRGGKSFLIDNSGKDEYQCPSKNYLIHGRYRYNNCNYLLDLGGRDNIFGKRMSGINTVNHLDFVEMKFELTSIDDDTALSGLFPKDDSIRVVLNGYDNFEEYYAHLLYEDTLYMYYNLTNKDYISYDAMMDFVCDHLHLMDEKFKNCNSRFISIISRNRIIGIDTNNRSSRITLSRLIDSTRSKNRNVANNSSDLLYYSFSNELPLIYDLFLNSEGEIRRSALVLFARYGREGEYPEIEKLLESEIAEERAAAVYACYMLAKDEFPESFVSIPNDKSAMVRNAYYYAMDMSISYNLSLIIDGITHAFNDKDRDFFYDILPQYPPREAVYDQYKEIIFDLPDNRREELYKAVQDDERWMKFLRKNSVKEKSGRLRSLIR
jgi:hypothetical protein